MKKRACLEAMAEFRDSEHVNNRDFEKKMRIRFHESITI
jgi:hypothetical protein